LESFVLLELIVWSCQISNRTTYAILTVSPKSVILTKTEIM
jgi:hypothetical protein